MKIGILTFHRAHNYGAVLQCYALQEVLKGMGHEVQVINYLQPFIESEYKVFSLSRLLKTTLARPKGGIAYIKDIVPVNRIMKNNFTSFRSKFLNMTDECAAIPKNFDVYLIGSDQLWGNCLGGQLDPYYFGDFPHTDKSKIIGYAISSNIGALRKFGWDTIRRLVSNMDAVSVRESNIAKVFKENLGIEAHIDIDPTLLLPKVYWKPVINNKWNNHKYVLVYYVKRGFGEYAHNVLMSKARVIANNNNLEIIDLSTKTYCVEDFVSLFSNATCVVTSSFHATAFSVIFHRPIYAVKLHDGSDGRYVDLLQTLNMSGCLIEMDTYVDSIPMVNYSEVEEKLLKLRAESTDYLNNELHD